MACAVDDHTLEELLAPVVATCNSITVQDLAFKLQQPLEVTSAVVVRHCEQRPRQYVLRYTCIGHHKSTGQLCIWCTPSHATAVEKATHLTDPIIELYCVSPWTEVPTKTVQMKKREYLRLKAPVSDKKPVLLSREESIKSFQRTVSALAGLSLGSSGSLGSQSPRTPLVLPPPRVFAGKSKMVGPLPTVGGSPLETGSLSQISNKKTVPGAPVPKVSAFSNAIDEDDEPPKSQAPKVEAAVAAPAAKPPTRHTSTTEALTPAPTPIPAPTLTPVPVLQPSKETDIDHPPKALAVELFPTIPPPPAPVAELAPIVVHASPNPSKSSVNWVSAVPEPTTEEVAPLPDLSNAGLVTVHQPTNEDSVVEVTDEMPPSVAQPVLDTDPSSAPKPKVSAFDILKKAAQNQSTLPAKGKAAKAKKEKENATADGEGEGKRKRKPKAESKNNINSLAKLDPNARNAAGRKPRAGLVDSDEDSDEASGSDDDEVQRYLAADQIDAILSSVNDDIVLPNMTLSSAASTKTGAEASKVSEEVAALPHADDSSPGAKRPRVVELPPSQMRITTFCSPALVEFQKSYEKFMDMEMDKIGEEYVCRDVVRYRHRQSGLVLSVEEYRNREKQLQQEASASPGAAGGKAGQSTSMEAAKPSDSSSAPQAKKPRLESSAAKPATTTQVGSKQPNIDSFFRTPKL
jgi:hypothetical protein